MELKFEGESEPEGSTGFVNSDLLLEPATERDNGSNGEIQCQQCGNYFQRKSMKGKTPTRCYNCRGTSSAPSRGGSKSIDVLIEQMTGLYAGAAAGLQFVPAMQFDAMIIANNAAKMAESWRPLIERDAGVRKFWERMTTGGGWGTVIFAHGMVAMTIAHAHDVKLPSFGKQPAEQEGISNE